MNYKEILIMKFISNSKKWQEIMTIWPAINKIENKELKDKMKELFLHKAAILVESVAGSGYE